MDHRVYGQSGADNCLRKNFVPNCENLVCVAIQGVVSIFSLKAIAEEKAAQHGRPFPFQRAEASTSTASRSQKRAAGTFFTSIQPCLHFATLTLLHCKSAPDAPLQQPDYPTPRLATGNSGIRAIRKSARGRSAEATRSIFHFVKERPSDPHPELTLYVRDHRHSVTLWVSDSLRSPPYLRIALTGRSWPLRSRLKAIPRGKLNSGWGFRPLRPRALGVRFAHAHTRSGVSAWIARYAALYVSNARALLTHLPDMAKNISAVTSILRIASYTRHRATKLKKVTLLIFANKSDF